MRAGPCGDLVRDVRFSAYARYLDFCSDVAESVGITTRPWETRALSRSGWWARNVRMCESWISAKFDASSALTTLLVRKFMPCSPAHWAERMLAPPYHIRLPRPGEYGSTRLEKTSNPSVPLKSVAGLPRTKSS